MSSASSRAVAFVAALAVAIVSLFSFGGPAWAAEHNFVELDVTAPGQNFEQMPVFQPGVDYTLNLRYSAMDDGYTTTFPVPSSVEIPASSLVVPPGNTAVDKLELVNGELKVTFKDPFPTDINQGSLGIKFRFDAVTKSTVTEFPWKVGGKDPGKIVIKTPSDTPNTVKDSMVKSGNRDGSNLAQYVTISGGTVKVKPTITGAEFGYSVVAETTSAKSNQTFVDQLPDFFAYKAGSSAVTQETWDADGLNRTSSSLPAPAFSTTAGAKLTTTLDLPANSRTTIQYTTRVTDVAGLEAKLQQIWDAQGRTGILRYDFANAVDFAGESDSVAGRFDVVSSDGIPQDVGLYKAADWSDIHRNPDADGIFRPAIPIAFILADDISNFDGSTPERTLTGDVLLVDELNPSLSWQADDPDFLTWINGTAPASTTRLPDGSSDAAVRAAGLGAWAVSGKRLVVNTGSDVQNHPVTNLRMKAQVDNTANLAENPVKNPDGSTQLIVPNTLTAIKADGGTNSTAWRGYINTSDKPIANDALFNKTVEKQEYQVEAGKTADVTFTLVTRYVGDLSNAVWTDDVDHSIFDVTEASLPAIKNSIVGSTAGFGLRGEDFDLTLNADGDLEFRPSAGGKPKFAGSDTEYFSFTLTTKPVPAKTTLDITNSATLSGSTSKQEYVNSVETSATSYGDELEVVKKVLDPTKKDYESDVKVELGEDGKVVAGQSDVVYRIRVYPHGSFNKMVVDITDALPTALTFKGFADANGTVIPGTTYPIPNTSLVAQYDAATKDVTIPKGDVSPGKFFDLYFVANINDPQPNIPIKNVVGRSVATVTPTPVESAKSYAVGDYTWVDTDKDGVQDAGEPVLAGVKVELLDKDGAVKATTTTDSKGLYLFDELAAGDYQVRFTLTEEQAKKFVFTTDGSGAAASDSDAKVGADPKVGLSKVFTLDDSNTALTKSYDTKTVKATQGIDPTWDAGVITPSVSVGDYVWVDADRDGVQDAGEKPIKDVVLTVVGPDGKPVTDVAGNPVGSTKTDADGKYTFDGLPVLPAGDHYTVVIDRDASAEVLKPYVPTKAGEGDRATDSSTWTAESTDLTKDGDRDPTLDFGFVTKSYAVGDYTWVDTDKDGVQDAGEPVLAGVKVELLDKDGAVKATTTTDSKGLYLFDELAAGDYQVRFTLTDEQASKFVFTTDGSGAAAADSDAKVAGDPKVGLSKVFTLDDSNTALTKSYDAKTVKATQGIDPTWDAGVITPSVSVGDYVWVDADRDGVQDAGEKPIKDVVLTVVGPDGKPVTDVAGNPVGSTKTDADGKYTFDGLPVLPAGDHYTVVIDRDASAEVLKPYVPTKAGEGDRATDSSTWSSESTDLTKDGDRDPTLDFGFVTKTYAVGDYTWIDKDRDGVQDENEQVLPGVKVDLLDKDGKVVSSTTTDSKGLYLFDELAAGDYQVRFTLTDEQAKTYVFTTDGSGAAASDSDAKVGSDPKVGTSKVFTLDDSNTALTKSYDAQTVKATQGIDPTWDAGVVPAKVSVGDYVWVDADRDGRQDAGEKPVKDVVLNVVGPDGRPVTDVLGLLVGSTKTDAEGKYTFDNLPVLPAGQHYTVVIDRDASAEVLKPYVPTKAGEGDRATDSSTWTAESTDLTKDGDRDPTLDFGFVTKTYAVGDYTWVDADKDGVQDAGEPVLSGVKVDLLDKDGKVVSSTTTDSKGLYLFDELAAGDYQVRFTLTDEQASKFVFTTDGSGAAAADSDAKVGADPKVGLSKVFTLDDSNTALTKSYDAQTVKATQGIDPTWDAGVVLKPVAPTTVTETPTGVGGVDDSVSPDDDEATDDEETDDSLAMTGAEISLGVLVGAMVLIAGGAVIALTGGRRSRED